MNSDEWRDELAGWLQGFPWQWLCSLTFRPGLSEPQARWRLRHWVGDLRDALGTPDFQWIGVPELGRTGLDFHFHVLVAGLRKWHAPERMEWMARWYKLAGDAHIAVYRAGVGGVGYILKSIGPNDMDEIEFELHSRTQMQTGLGAK